MQSDIPADHGLAQGLGHDSQKWPLWPGLALVAPWHMLDPKSTENYTCLMAGYSLDLMM